jgi:hypothetical protein
MKIVDLLKLSLPNLLVVKLQSTTGRLRFTRHVLLGERIDRHSHLSTGDSPKVVKTGAYSHPVSRCTIVDRLVIPNRVLALALGSIFWYVCVSP